MSDFPKQIAIMVLFCLAWVTTSAPPVLQKYSHAVFRVCLLIWPYSLMMSMSFPAEFEKVVFFLDPTFHPSSVAGWVRASTKMTVGLAVMLNPLVRALSSGVLHPCS